MSATQPSPLPAHFVMMTLLDFWIHRPWWPLRSPTAPLPLLGSSTSDSMGETDMPGSKQVLCCTESHPVSAPGRHIQPGSPLLRVISDDVSDGHKVGAVDDKAIVGIDHLELHGRQEPINCNVCKAFLKGLPVDGMEAQCTAKQNALGHRPPCTPTKNTHPTHPAVCAIVDAQGVIALHIFNVLLVGACSMG